MSCCFCEVLGHFPQFLSLSALCDYDSFHGVCGQPSGQQNSIHLSSVTLFCFPSLALSLQINILLWACQTRLLQALQLCLAHTDTAVSSPPCWFTCLSPGSRRLTHPGHVTLFGINNTGNRTNRKVEAARLVESVQCCGQRAGFTGPWDYLNFCLFIFIIEHVSWPCNCHTTTKGHLLDSSTSLTIPSFSCHSHVFACAVKALS